MSAGNEIVFLDVVTPSVRKSLEENVPPGFHLTIVEADTEANAVAAVAGADYVMVWWGEMPTRVVEAATKARLIQKLGEGTDRIDLAAAARKGIPVAKTAGSNSASVAELATLLMLAILRRLPEAHSSTKAGQWLRLELRPGCREIRDKQVGIVGLGKIGRLVAEHMQGLRASVVYYDAYRLPEAEEDRLRVRFAPLDDLLRTSDVVTLHLPLNASTRGLIGRQELALMKPSAILINTCRGAVVDEEALYEVLQERRIRGAGIDAYCKEPPGPNHPLLSLDNVVLTPHIGGTEDSEVRCICHGFANIMKVSQGQQLDPADLVLLTAPGG